MVYNVLLKTRSLQFVRNLVKIQEFFRLKSACFSKRVIMVFRFEQFIVLCISKVHPLDHNNDKQEMANRLDQKGKSGLQNLKKSAKLGQNMDDVI